MTGKLLHDFPGGNYSFMKRYTVIALLLLFQLSLFAAPVNPAQVTISLTTRVPEYLVHGFLKTTEGSQVIVSSTEVDDAFNTRGASFTYAIQTNVSIPLKVTATVSPFNLQYAPTSYQVGIDKIYVRESEAAIPSEAPVDSTSGTYNLVEFTPNASGMATYAYTLTVLANQTQVQNAPSGSYESTVSIGITPNN